MYTIRAFCYRKKRKMLGMFNFVNFVTNESYFDPIWFEREVAGQWVSFFFPPPHKPEERMDNGRTFKFASPSSDNASSAFRFGDLSRVRHAGYVNVRPPARRFHEADQGDVVGQRQIVELRMNHDVADIQFFVRQLFRGHAHVVLAQTNFQDGADVSCRQTAKLQQTFESKWQGIKKINQTKTCNSTW